jgi:hypothetical protein
MSTTKGGGFSRGLGRRALLSPSAVTVEVLEEDGRSVTRSGRRGQATGDQDLAQARRARPPHEMGSEAEVKENFQKRRPRIDGRRRDVPWRRRPETPEPPTAASSEIVPECYGVTLFQF